MAVAAGPFPTRRRRPGQSVCSARRSAFGIVFDSRRWTVVDRDQPAFRDRDGTTCTVAAYSEVCSRSPTTARDPGRLPGGLIFVDQN